MSSNLGYALSAGWVALFRVFNGGFYDLLPDRSVSGVYLTFFAQTMTAFGDS